LNDPSKTSAVELNGQVAVVTGGGRGIGRAIAQALAAAGASVAVVARSAHELAETVALIALGGGRARAFPADVTDAKGIRKTFAEIQRSLGPVDLLVNNAGAVGPIGPFWDTDDEEWWRAVEVNLRGPMHCSRAVLPGMIARRRGRIINVASGAGLLPMAYLSAYVTAKTALVRFTENLAAETKPHGISLFVISPGAVRTAMSEYSLFSPEGQRWLPWFRKIFEEGLDVPVERPARLVLDLASGKADPLSGRFLSVQDDLDVLLESSSEIEKESLYALRMRQLGSGSVNPALARIRAAAGCPLENTLRLERTIAAPPETVFHAWTDAAGMAKWFLPQSGAHWVRPPEIDARVGGKFSISVCTETDGNVYNLQGTYCEMKAPEKLAFTWQWGVDFPVLGGPADTFVVVELVAQGRETKLVLTHEKFPSVAARDAHARGWARCLDGIARLLS
jgi:NAD(P)-dependent dehydrogenase (short-subunit alcohol dehydrogenase family)/uncharacterized protein YndB with AHSA1/START domain